MVAVLVVGIASVGYLRTGARVESRGSRLTHCAEIEAEKK